MREGLFQRQARRVLEQEKYAFISAMILAAAPFMEWLALSIMALVTLRHGVKAGFRLLLPIMLVQVLVSILKLPLITAVFAATLSVLPCYLAASTLQLTTSWRAVSGMLLGLVVVGAISLQLITPDFIGEQYVHLESALRNMARSQMNALEFWQNKGISPHILANYLLGVQAASLAFSAVVPLLFARSLQSQLFYPEGFRQEMLNFKGDKLSFALLALLLVLAYYEQLLAINALPAVLFYFLLAGLSFTAYAFSHLKPLVLFAVLILPLVLLAWLVVPLYLLFGAFDSLFNFRLYLSSKTGKAT